MRLNELEKFHAITIQCHDNPDADAIASAFGLYCYFFSKNVKVRMIYSGKAEITKPNLIMMVKELQIPIFHEPDLHKVDGLLITVDCQYGAGNVTKIEADEVACIDHHQEEIRNIKRQQIIAGVGSCSTIVYKMLKKEKFPLTNINLCTALYYGLCSDTSQLAEIYHPWDKDMRDEIQFDKELITLFRNSNMTLQELSLMGVAMLRYIYNEKYAYAIVKADSCDPNLLGMISDILVQVDQVHTALVYNQLGEGYKFSVRSCTKEVKASEMASYLAKNMGSGGGHVDKAGGFISVMKYEKEYPGLHTEAYFSARMQQYFEETSVIYAREYEIDIDEMQIYKKKKLLLGYIILSKIFEIGTPITIRTMEGDVDVVVTEDLCIMIGVKGNAYPNSLSNLKRNYQISEEPYQMQTDYKPVIKNKKNGETCEISDKVKLCVSKDKSEIYAQKLEKRVKIFTEWDDTVYMLGEEGDFIVARKDNLKDIYIVDQETFDLSYEEMEK